MKIVPPATTGLDPVAKKDHSQPRLTGCSAAGDEASDSSAAAAHRRSADVHRAE